MWWGFGLTAALLLTAPTAFAKEARYKAGQAHERTTSEGVKYAVYLPKKWKRGKPLPLIVSIPNQRILPIDTMKASSQHARIEEFNATGGGVIFCSVMAKAHNLENPFWKKSIDVPRYVRLLERDVHALEAVLAELERDLAIERDVTALQSQDYAAEVALGLAVRRPHLFMALVVTDLITRTRYPDSKPLRWDVLPPRSALAPALDLPILFHVIYDEPTQAKRGPRNRQVRDALKTFGFRRVRFLEPDMRLKPPPRFHPDYHRAYEEILAAARVLRAHRDKRDAYLTTARKHADRKSLEPALQAWRKARALEEKHRLRCTSNALYADLEAEGRRRLAATEALSESKRRVARRKLARLFKGLPLGKELD